MNKIFTSLLMLGAAFAASAQNFTVSSVDGPVANGATLSVGYDYNSEWDMYDWDPELTIHANKAGTYTISATASESGVVQFCGFTGQCTILKPSASRSASISAGQEVPMQLDIKGAFELLSKPVSLEVTVTDGSETVKFTVNFVNEDRSAGITAPAKAAGTLRFAGRTLNFSLENAATFTLYNISGRQVMSRALNGTGSVNLSAIPAGVYVYRCGTATGKVIIK
ncbi:MAG: T9SS type A sorting domain-containing protein [Muribaculaceae bacterium]|nr:T9SS type A sorting domain-containing protein [Muribaculaceae bacterium]